MPVSVCDVGPRDGLQNDKVTLEPAIRAELCTRLASAGLQRIEAASFVHPKLVPQMAGAEEVFASLPPNGATYASLVLNRKGLDRALQTTTTEIHVAYPVTETFARRNQNTTVEEAARTAEEIIGASELKTTATISVAFGCPFEGHVDPGLVIEHAHRMAQAGADEVILADTIGVGVPRQVKELVPRALQGGKPVGLHMHNTRNTGYANAIAGLEHGATIFDATRRRPRRLPVRAARDGQHRHRGPDLPAGERGRRDGRRPRRADRRRGVARNHDGPRATRTRAASGQLPALTAPPAGSRRRRSGRPCRPAPARARERSDRPRTRAG